MDRRVIFLTGLLSVPAFAQWSPVGLSKELYPIAHLESSWGKNTNHEAHSKGRWSSAHGALGLKASTAYDAMLRSRKFIEKWSTRKDYTLNITNKDVFFEFFISNSEFYNELATIHWHYLRQNTSSVEQAVYAWRWGIGAADRAENHSEDKYVAAYMVRQ